MLVIRRYTAILGYGTTLGNSIIGNGSTGNTEIRKVRTPFWRIVGYGRRAALFVEDHEIERQVRWVSRREKVVLDDFSASITVFVVSGPSKTLVVIEELHVLRL